MPRAAGVSEYSVSVMTDTPEPAPRSDVKAFFYESFAREWDSQMNVPELNKRLRLVFGGLLEEVEVRGEDVLDAGAGTGWFSRRLTRRGGRVTSLGVGPELMDQVRRKCDSRLVVGSVARLAIPGRLVRRRPLHRGDRAHDRSAACGLRVLSGPAARERADAHSAQPRLTLGGGCRQLPERAPLPRL
jgi:SAM-dependent methyltransferase